MLVLASASPRRRDLLTSEGLPFRVQPSDAEEITHAETPALLTTTNALIKARPIAELNPESVVIGADTLVFLDGESLGKPSDLEEAERMVGRLAGRTHEVITGVAIMHVKANLEETFHVASQVTFKQLNADEIRDYLGVIEPLDKAGGYAAQEHGDKIIASIEGPESNVIGLPVEKLREILHSDRWESLWTEGNSKGD